MEIDIIKQQFKEKFGNHDSRVYAAPGRVNLIGEHTDYNGSFVFPGAIDKGMVAVIRSNGIKKVRAWSVNLQDYAEFTMEESDLPRASWARYIFGVCREIIKRGGKPGGFDTAFAGDVPLGAGMSSSAALESTYAYALNDMFSLGIDKMELVRITVYRTQLRRVKCGIMDQFISLLGKRESYPSDTEVWSTSFSFSSEGYRLVLLDTVVKHELALGLQQRRESCENAARTARERTSHGISQRCYYGNATAGKRPGTGRRFMRAHCGAGTERVLAVSDSWNG